MANTKGNLDLQSDKVLTNPRFQTVVDLKDASAANTLKLDWDEPAGTNRTINLEDPGANDTIAYLNKAQTFLNKSTTTVPTLGPHLVNKTYVDAAVAGGVPDATSAPGAGGTKGKWAADSLKGLQIVAGIGEVKIDGVTITFNGSGQLVGSASVVDGTSGPGGATKGKLTADSNLGLQVTAGVLEVKIDPGTLAFNGFGELQVIGGGGGPTGTVSLKTGFAENIVAVTPPGNGTTAAGDISTLDYPDGSTTGVRFEVTVPEDYFSGALTIYATYQMSSASASNVVRVSTQAKIADIAGGAIDSVTYPETQADLTVPATTAVTRQALLQILSGDFAAGDTIVVLVKRFGAHANDIHPGDWKVINFTYAYTAVIDSRVANQVVDFWENAPGETPTTPVDISGGDLSTESFPAAATAGARADFTVPDNWDGISDCEVRLNYAMSAASLTTPVRMEVRAKIAGVVSGTISAIPFAFFDFTPPNDTGPHQAGSLITIPAASLSKGDTVSLIFARRPADPTDTHPGDLYGITLVVTFRTLPTTGFTVLQEQEEYLNSGVFGNAVGAVTGSTDYADLVDFETYDRLSSAAPAGVLHIAYAGRLGSAQTLLSSIKFTVKGVGASPQYTLKVYAEGTGQVYTSGLIPAPGVPTLVSKTNLDLSAQPTGQKRFFVVVETAIDAGEAVLVSRPFVRKE